MSIVHVTVTHHRWLMTMTSRYAGHNCHGRPSITWLRRWPITATAVCVFVVRSCRCFVSQCGTEQFAVLHHNNSYCRWTRSADAGNIFRQRWTPSDAVVNVNVTTTRGPCTTTSITTTTTSAELTAVSQMNVDQSVPLGTGSPLSFVPEEKLWDYW